MLLLALASDASENADLNEVISFIKGCIYVKTCIRNYTKKPSLWKLWILWLLEQAKEGSDYIMKRCI